MSFCEQCGAKLAPGAAFCEGCGASARKVDVAFGSKAADGAANAAFCEECGTPLPPGSSFCEECGTQVANARPSSASRPKIAEPLPRVESEDGNADISGYEPDLCFFRSSCFRPTWEVKWKNAVENAGGNEIGLLVSRFNGMCGTHSDIYKELPGILSNFMTSAAKRGVRYYYLDLENDCEDVLNQEYRHDVEFVVDILKKIVDVARPKYILILGGEDIVPVAEWKNEAGDGDETVLSDLPYVTLDTTSPWEGQKFSFKNCLRVGRLPTYDCGGAGWQNGYYRYLAETAKAIGHFGEIVPYGLSAQIWEDESNDEYTGISNGRVEVSPHITDDNVSIPADANLLFFNLHGSDENCHWFGQNDHNSFPEAFSPARLEENRKPYILAVEACYGARYTGGLQPEDSLLLTAMEHGCVAFLGSSKIAFGTPRPKGCCADTLVGEFIKSVAAGDTVGDAYISGLNLLAAEAEDPNGGTPEVVKSIAEFSLYGDPSACIGKNKNVGSVKKFMKALGGVPKGIHIAMPDIRRASKMALAEVDKKIEAIVDDFAMRELGIVPGSKAVGMVESKTFCIPNRNINLKAYDVGAGNKRRQLRVYFDGNGKITKSLHSK